MVEASRFIHHQEKRLPGALQRSFLWWAIKALWTSFAINYACLALHVRPHFTLCSETPAPDKDAYLCDECLALLWDRSYSGPHRYLVAAAFSMRAPSA